MRFFSTLLLIFLLASPAFAAQKRSAAPVKKPVRPVEQIYLESEVVIDPIDQIAYDQDGIPLSGTIQGFYQNGRLAWETQWMEGKLHGVTRHYFNNRKLQEETTWVNGKMHGPARWYDEQGKLRREIVYENDKDPSAPAEAQAEDAPAGNEKEPPAPAEAQAQDAPAGQDKAPEKTPQ